MRPLTLLILQPTKLCNLNCSYCYLPHRDVAGCMKDSVIEAVCDKILSSRFVGSQVAICLHGGEPLAAGVDWFRRCVEIVDSKLPDNVLEVQWSVQTNAILLTDEWLDLFEQHSVQVGVSLDGPCELHDLRRKNWSGHGSFAKTLAGIEKLKERAIPFSVLSVLHEASLSQADDIFHFFRDLGPIEVAFNVEETEAAHTGGTLDNVEAKSLTREFFRKYWDLSAEYGFPHEVREFRHIINVIEGVLAGQRLLNEVAEPVCCISVATDGDFATFAPELLEPSAGTSDARVTVIGNIVTDDFDMALRSERFQKLYKDISEGVSACEGSCFYFPFCGGGSPSNKFFELGSFKGTETFYCRNGLQAVVDEALARISAPLLLGGKDKKLSS